MVVEDGWAALDMPTGGGLATTLVGMGLNKPLPGAGKLCITCCKVCKCYNQNGSYMHEFILRVSSPQNAHFVINYSPSCRSKPIRPSFIFGTHIKVFRAF